MVGLFETIRIKSGQVPFLGPHLARLTASSRALGREPPAPGLSERVRAHAPESGDLIVRVTLGAHGERIETRPLPPPDPMRIVFSGTRHEPYPHKSTERDVFDRARRRVVPFRADEAILFDPAGHLAEGCICSVF